MESIKDLKEKIQELKESMTNIKNSAEYIINKISQNQVLTEDASDEMKRFLDLHLSKTEECKKLYERITNKEIEIKEVEGLEQAIEKIEESAEQKKLIEKFLRLKSDDVSVEELLKEERKKLTEIIERLSGDIAKLREDTEAYRKFADYIEDINNMDANAIILAMTEMLNVFDSRLVTEAFVMNKVYLGDEIKSLDIKDNSNISANDKNVMVDSKNNQNSENDNDKSKSSEDEKRSESVQGEDTDNPLGIVLKENNVLYPVDYSFGVLTCEKSHREESKFGAKEFKNEINSGSYPKMEKKILHDICKFNYLRIETIQLINEKIKPEAIEASLTHLYNRGFIRKYSLSNIGEFYCSSPKTNSALQSQAVKNFIGIRGKREEGVLIEDASSSALARYIFLTLLEYEIKYNIERTSMIYMSTILTNSFVNMYANIKDEKFDMIIGSTMNSLSDVCYLDESITRVCEDDKNINRVIVAGYDKEFTKNLASTLLSVYKNLNGIKKIYIYSLLDNKFYKYKDFQALEIDEIWNHELDNEIDIEEKDLPIAEKHNNSSEKKEEKKEVNKDSKGSDDKKSSNGKSKDTKDNVKLEKEDVDSSSTPKIKENIEESSSGKGNNSQTVEKTIDDKDPMEAMSLSDEDIREIKDKACQMILDGNTYCATAYLASYGNLSRRAYALYDKLAYAVNDPMMRISYSANNMYDSFFDDDSSWHDYLATAAILRTFFYNHVPYDFEMPSLYELAINNLSVIKECSSISLLLHELIDFRKKYNKGIDVYADYRMKEKVELEKDLKKIVIEAKEFYEKTINKVMQERTSMQRFIETKKLIFSKDNEIPVFLNAICENDSSYNELASDFIIKTFIRNDRPMDIANIDSSKIDDYMDDYWNKAASLVRTKKHSSQLMSSLRQNLYKAIYKSICIICRWLMCASLLDKDMNDKGLIDYRNRKTKIHSYIDESLEYFRDEKEELTDEENAGRVVIYDTLYELKERVDGSYIEGLNKYFYIQFLLSDLVLLDDDYLPEIEMCYQDVPTLAITQRIYNHSQTKLISFNQRLDDLFKNYGDDFGSAKLIMDYLKDTQREDIEEEYNLEESIRYTEGGFERNKKKFVEDLELMQSYGQIDTTSEGNTKEKILQIVTEAFEKAKKSKNFGFFKKVIEAYKSFIKESSKIREDSLKIQLEEFRKEAIKEENKQELDIKLDKVQRMLEIQNYTVAEDLLSRYKNSEPDSDLEVLPKDYLKMFIEKYDYYKSIVARSERKLSLLIGTEGKNKDERGAQRMIDNWIVFRDPPEKYKIGKLLESLGFNVGVVEANEKINSIYSFNVQLSKPKNGRKANFKHPITAFGSKACNDGFRVVTLFGRSDADRLIAQIRTLGGNKDTIILLDYALDLAERRKLARKIKSESFGKTFAIIDRVVIHFLMDVYNSEYVNQILMSIIMPFSFGQPYIWDSANVMPPEIFMGRSEELEKIELPSGVNIVYGGRQLGKSALLKMAKNEIDHDEYGNRAVLVEIKDLGYEKAAKKIGHALYDNGILDKDPNTTDWDELTRAISNRLKQEKARIPYLLLLLDEADAFIASCKEINYHPFDALKEIQSIGADRFKFVIAGLRSIVKFNREVALGNNSVITHLKDLTVRPFNYKEARELLEVPLYYLGFRFSEKKDYLISSIFANANYFPGLIQLYCAKLVEAMKKGDYAGYNESDSPIYEIHEDHIKKVLGEAGFREQVREKYEITLKLDEDNFYYIIALLIAKLYHEHGYTNGYTASNILDAGYTYEIAKIKNLTEDKTNAFLQELCDLNVLRKNSDNRYLFNRHNFFQMMGNEDEVDDRLLECMEE